MLIKMNRDEVVASYGGDVEESGFVKSAVESAIVRIAENYSDWNEYDVQNIDNVNNEHVTYELNLLDKENKVVYTANIEINVPHEVVEIEIKN